MNDEEIKNEGADSAAAKSLPRRSLSEIRDLVKKSSEGIKPDVDMRPFEQYLLLTHAAGTNEQATDGYLQIEAAASTEFLMNAFVAVAAELYAKSPFALMDAMQSLKARIHEGA